MNGTLLKVIDVRVATATLVVLASIGSGAFAADQDDLTHNQRMQRALIEAHGGYNWIASDSFNSTEDDQYAIFGGWAGVTFRPHHGWGAQFEAFGERTTAAATTDDYVSSIGAGAHLFHTYGDRLIGLMGGLVYTDVGTGGPAPENTTWGGLIGLEGQVHQGRTTYYGQIAYADYPGSNIGADEDFPRDTVMLRGVVRHFPTDITKLEAELGTAFGAHDNASRFVVTNWALEGERSLGEALGAPTSVFARYEGIYAREFVGDTDYSLDTTFRVGLRVLIDSANLYQNNMNGVSLDLPDLGRLGGVLNGPIE